MIGRRRAEALAAARSLAESARLLVQTLEGRPERAPDLALELLEYDVTIAEGRLRTIRAFSEMLGLALSPADVESLRQASEELRSRATEGRPDATCPADR